MRSDSFIPYFDLCGAAMNLENDDNDNQYDLIWHHLLKVSLWLFFLQKLKYPTWRHIQKRTIQQRQPRQSQRNTPPLNTDVKLFCVWCVFFYIYCCFEAQSHSEDNISLHSLSGALPLIMITQFCISLNLTDIMITQFRIPRMCI